MPPVVLTAQEQTDALKAGSSELKYLLAMHGVSDRVQAQLYHVGVLTVARFGNFCRTETELVEVAKTEIGIDAATSLAVRSEVAGLVCAYTAARTRSNEVSKFQGEMEAKKLQKPLLNSTFLVMKSAYEGIHGPLEDNETPARVYLERRIAELEGGDLRAEDLKSILNREQDGDETLQPHWDTSGVIRLKRSVAEVDDPSNPEELRRRLGLMFVGLGFIALQHTNRPELQGIGPTLMHSYAQYLLGEHVWQLLAKDADGNPIASPAWGLVLKYEFAIRKKAYRSMQETGRTFAVCLREAWLDPLVKERSFTTPMAIAAATGRQVVALSTNSPKGGGSSSSQVKNQHLKQESGWASRAEQKVLNKEGRARGRGPKGKAKSPAKGRGKSSSSSTRIPKGCGAKTPDGEFVCYGYNDAETRCRKPECSFKHVCGLCYQKGHPMYACRGNKGKAPSSETQGDGA